MIEVSFAVGQNNICVPAIYQWDYNRKLKISGLGAEVTDKVYQVHFFNKRTKKSIVRIAYYQSDKTYTVDIPNALLREQYDICACIYLNNYAAASGVNAETEGIYYILSSKGYEPVTLPDDYAAGSVYYQRAGQTVKRISIPVIARAEPEDLISPPDPTEEDIVSELMLYINKLGLKFDNYVQAVDAYTNATLTVKEVSQAEYNALEAAGSLNPKYLYYIVNADIQNAVNALQQDLEDGEVIPMKAETADEANYADNAGTVNGVEIKGDGVKGTYGATFTGLFTTVQTPQEDVEFGGILWVRTVNIPLIDGLKLTLTDGRGTVIYHPYGSSGQEYIEMCGVDIPTDSSEENEVTFTARAEHALYADKAKTVTPTSEEPDYDHVKITETGIYVVIGRDSTNGEDYTDVLAIRDLNISCYGAAYAVQESSNSGFGGATVTTTNSGKLFRYDAESKRIEGNSELSPKITILRAHKIADI